MAVGMKITAFVPNDADISGAEVWPGWLTEEELRAKGLELGARKGHKKVTLEKFEDGSYLVEFEEGSALCFSVHLAEVGEA